MATSNDPGEVDDRLALGRPEILPVERTPLLGNEVRLEGAQVVVGGGRGLDADCFAQLDRIAHSLGGAVNFLPTGQVAMANLLRQVTDTG